MQIINYLCYVFPNVLLIYQHERMQNCNCDNYDLHLARELAKLRLALSSLHLESILNYIKTRLLASSFALFGRSGHLFCQFWSFLLISAIFGQFQSFLPILAIFANFGYFFQFQPFLPLFAFVGQNTHTRTHTHACTHTHTHTRTHL